MSKLLIVSNRLPFTTKEKKGHFQFETSIGGLASGLGSLYKSYNTIWVGWPGISHERIKGREKDIETKLLSENCRPVFISEHDVRHFYYGFCNSTIWPIFHYFPQYAAYDRDQWRSYQKVNNNFADVVAQTAEYDDIIWVHDYQLMLLPKLLRERLPKAIIGFFLHVPFPSYEIFRLLPWRWEILDGLLGADLVGFHTYDYVVHFLESIHHVLGYDSAMGQIVISRGMTKADAFPMGIDCEKYSAAVQSQKVLTQVGKLRQRFGGQKVILSVDRLDYTKGIAQRLEAIQLFWEKNPQYLEKVTFIMLVAPSRLRAGPYKLLKDEVDKLVGAINGRYGTVGWTPIWYLYRSLPFQSLIPLYQMADIALVTPQRDGMNLVAKEYISTKTDGKGVLILSETAGAAQELGEAIIINPNNWEEVARALEEALTMTDEEQIERNRVMQRRLRRYNIVRWAKEFIERLLETKRLQADMEVRIMNDGAKRDLARDFHQSKRRLIFLDYDGTLVPFQGVPDKAEPGNELLVLLEKLAADHRNEVVLLSGRNRLSLEKWFGQLGINLVAEHGAWVKERDREWRSPEWLTSDWKKELYPILELWVDRTPGSFVEEKDFSLVWHYRAVDPKLSNVRAREVGNELSRLTANFNLQVLEGSKVIEIKNAGINKGTVALGWISKGKWDFILAVGDDVTDEDMFRILPDTACSIKVGPGASMAKYNLSRSADVRDLLERLIAGTK